jgi:hypothetical protein
MNNNSISGKPEITQENVSALLDTLAKKRSIIPVAFALVIIFFFFGFVDFKCNSVKVASLSGINLVTGTHVKTPSDDLLNDNAFNSLIDNRNLPRNEGQKVEPNFWAILALLMAIGGLAAFYKKIKKESLAGAAAGAIGFISLLILRSAIRNKVGEQAGGIQVDVDFLLSYWASLLAFFAAGGLSYLRLKQEKLIESATDIKPVSKPVTPLHVNIITQDKSHQS